MPALHPSRDRSPAQPQSAFAWLAALFFWSVLLLVLSLLPGDGVPSPFAHADKLEHVVAYAVLSVLWAGTLCAWRAAPGPAWPIAALAAFGYGAVIELLQRAMQLGRSAEWGDLLANALGILFGCVVFRRICRRYWQQRVTDR